MVVPFYFPNFAQNKREETIMIISVANPIYDAVFKYLMEDNRIAKTVLSALLQHQTYKDGRNRQVLRIDDAIYKGDAEMERILHRLLAAASDSKLRQDMNVEDEYFSAIESRDTAIMKRDQKIAEQDAQLEEQRASLLASAKAMKAAGISEEQIAAMTKINIEDIKLL